jgi:RTX calcium-binding nonapeptide repeat (4 copies)
VVGTFLIGCAALLLVVGCAGTRSETSKKEEQGSSPKATDSEEVRCEETRTIKVTWLQQYPDAGPIKQSVVFTTYDLLGCPNKGGLLSGTDKRDKLNGFDGVDEIRGLAGPDFIVGGAGNDVIYAGPGDDKGKGKYFDRNVMGNRGDDVLYGGAGNDNLAGYMVQDVGEDVYYGGDGNDDLGGSGAKGEDVYYGEGGNDFIFAQGDSQPDKLYCGKGKDRYVAEKIDYVDSSCEKKVLAPVP